MQINRRQRWRKFGITVTDLLVYRAALAAAKAGTAPLIINTFGDSTITGVGGGSPPASTANNGRNDSLARKLAAAFAADGLSENGADVFGFGVTPGSMTAAQYAAFNTDVTAVGSWGPSSANIVSIGAQMWSASSATGGDWTWNAGGRAFDTITVYYPKNTTLGTFAVVVDGTEIGTITNTGTRSVAKTTFTVSPGVHTVAMRWKSAGAFFIGVETLDSTDGSSVRIRNMGWGGADSTALCTDGASSGQFGLASTLPIVNAAHLTVLEAGLINNWKNGVATATTTANINTMFGLLASNGGDILLLGPTRSSTAITATVTQQAHIDAMAALANGTTRKHYDLMAGTGDYAAMNGAGRMFDLLHPNATGYAAQANAIRAWLP